MKKLLPFGTNLPGPTQVWAELHHEGAQVEVHFWAQHLTALHNQPTFSLEHDRNWGLWNFDVVECFLYPQKKREVGRRTPYYEFQLSPLGQRFSLVIEKPRELFYSPFALNFTGKNELVQGTQALVWKATMNLELPQFKGSKLWGNLCACLGPASARQYFALNWNHQGVLDFHRPEAFVLLENTPEKI